jgi:hypothetical protein
MLLPEKLRRANVLHDEALQRLTPQVLSIWLPVTIAITISLFDVRRIECGLSADKGGKRQYLAPWHR